MDGSDQGCVITEAVEQIRIIHTIVGSDDEICQLLLFKRIQFGRYPFQLGMVQGTVFLAGSPDFFDCPAHRRTRLVQPDGLRKRVGIIGISQEIPMRLLCPSAKLPFNRIVVQIGDGTADVFVRHFRGQTISGIEQGPRQAIPHVVLPDKPACIEADETVEYLLAGRLRQYVDVVGHQADAQDTDIVAPRSDR